MVFQISQLFSPKYLNYSVLRSPKYLNCSLPNISIIQSYGLPNILIIQSYGLPNISIIQPQISQLFSLTVSQISQLFTPKYLNYSFMRSSLIFYRNEIQKMTGKDPLEQYGISEEARFQLGARKV
uniref:Uncharacterized protein n=1 Tax=Anolis carolinensis TaxID=28377 RepID=A0A803T3I1_ANOCA